MILIRSISWERKARRCDNPNSLVDQPFFRPSFLIFGKSRFWIPQTSQKSGKYSMCCLIQGWCNYSWDPCFVDYVFVWSVSVHVLYYVQLCTYMYRFICLYMHSVRVTMYLWYLHMYIYIYIHNVVLYQLQELPQQLSTPPKQKYPAWNQGMVLRQMGFALTASGDDFGHDGSDGRHGWIAWMNHGLIYG